MEASVTNDGTPQDGLDGGILCHRLQMLSWNPKDPFACTEKACMHHLIEAKAQELPESEAIHAWDGFVTYSQLEALANTFAQRLIRLGVGAGVYVPFACAKTLWTVVAMIGVLKAGGALVPLNPNDPISRLTGILEEVNARVVVATDDFAPKLKGRVKHVEVISAEAFSKYIHSKSRSSGGKFREKQMNEVNGCYARAVGPSDPIFVLFTSGSTGKPKGMVHEHAAICTHAKVHGEAMNYYGARMLQFAAYTFDIAFIDIFTTLIYGGCVCIPSDEDRTSNIVDVINAMGVDYVNLTPSFAGLIEPSSVPGLKTFAIGGEALSPERLARWVDHVSLIQIYGPAEVGICMINKMEKGMRAENVGFPLRNSSCWLVDPEDYNHLVPVGTVGELFIAGPSLARGYLDEQNTRSCFIVKPAWAVQMGLPFERFYKTGDLLRYNTKSLNGSYDFVGRKDAQIKLRGQRIEPGEVEYHISRLPSVLNSSVTQPANGCFAGELVAVVQMRQPGAQSSYIPNQPDCLSCVQAPTLGVVRESLSTTLPSYMVPTVFLAIDSMPYSPSLKVNRRRVNAWLASLESSPYPGSTKSLSQLAPSETIARAISHKVAELVTRNDEAERSKLQEHDFILESAGLDSIQIISVSMFLQKEYSLKLPINELLSPNVSIRTLASMVKRRERDHYADPILRLRLSPDIGQESKALTEKLWQEIDMQRAVNGFDICTKPDAPQNILLTGATGYLGSAILEQLLATAHIHVFALVRCSSETSGMQRIVSTALQSGWWRDSYAARIHVWCGDLSLPNMGLSDKAQRFLCGRMEANESSDCIHAVIHNGAKVHYNASYSTLAPTNISPTMFLLKVVATTPCITSFVFVSGGEKPNADTTSLPPDSPNQLGCLYKEASGYTQTKLVSEQIVRNCANHHPAFSSPSGSNHRNVRIVKPGYTVGSISSGAIAKRSDFIWRLIAGCVEIGAYNRDEADHWLFISDVDRVARRVVSAVFEKEEGEGVGKSEGQQRCNGHDGSIDRDGGNIEASANPGRDSRPVHRVLDGLPFSEVWALLTEELGYPPLQALGKEEWLSRLRTRVIESGEKHVLFPLLHVLERSGDQVGEKIWPHADHVAGVGEMKEVVESNLRYLIETGFMPPPPLVVENGAT